MAKKPDDLVREVIGNQAMQIIFLQCQLEEALEKIKDLTEAKDNPDAEVISPLRGVK